MIALLLSILVSNFGLHQTFSWSEWSTSRDEIKLPSANAASFDCSERYCYHEYYEYVLYRKCYRLDGNQIELTNETSLCGSGNETKLERCYNPELCIGNGDFTGRLVSRVDSCNQTWLNQTGFGYQKLTRKCESTNRTINSKYKCPEMIGHLDIKLMICQVRTFFLIRTKSLVLI